MGTGVVVDSEDSGRIFGRRPRLHVGNRTGPLCTTSALFGGQGNGEGGEERERVRWVHRPL